jgi:hypothetical protein
MQHIPGYILSVERVVDSEFAVAMLGVYYMTQLLLVLCLIVVLLVL